MRRLNDPLLPVRWVPADDLADDWAAVVALATSGAGWPAPTSSDIWAANTANLAGQGGTIASTLASIPTRRLVILGGPGAGKTMLLVRLVLDLLARREPGQPLPMLVSLASWNPAEQGLREWVVAEVIVNHPALAAPVGPSDGDRAQVLLERGFILPVLDGLDEIPEPLTSAAVAGINDAMRPGAALVLSCRTDTYQAATHPSSGAVVTLRGAAVVEVCPIDIDMASRYLLHDGGGSPRWAPVLDVLGTRSPAGQALTTPLMLSLARDIYNPRPGTYSGSLRNPAELCSPALSSRELVERHLLDAFIPAAYRRSFSEGRAGKNRWSTSKAERWLTYLASYLDYTLSSPNFAWWELQAAAQRPARKVVAATSAVSGLVLALAATACVTASVPARLTVGLTVAILTCLMVWGAAGRIQSPTTGVGWSVRFVLHPKKEIFNIRKLDYPSLKRIFFPIGAVLTIVVFGIAAEIAWLTIAATGAAVHAVYGNLADVASPHALLRRDRSSWLILGFTGTLYGIASGLVLGTALGRAIGVLSGITSAGELGSLVGLLLGLCASLGGIVSGVAWSHWRVSQLILVMRANLPLRLMSFLQDAHQRGILRQAGSVYQFRHLELQHRLATKGDCINRGGPNG
jgi:NACHT domain